MTVKQLIHRIKKTEEALQRERAKNNGIISRAGWGAGMRRVRIGPSFGRENRLEERIERYKKQLKELGTGI